MITLGIVDDNPEIRTQLSRIFELFDDIEVKFEVEDGDQVLHAIDRLIEPPQAIIMDIEMKRQDGIETTRQVKMKYPNMVILMLTVSDNNENILKAFEYGAQGYLLKGEKPMKMYEFIKNAVEGNISMSNDVAKQAVEMMLKSAKQNESKLKPEDFQLTKRELDVLKLISQGKDYQSIAEVLIISPQTVRSHTDNIYRKLGVHSKVEATNIVISNQWWWGAIGFYFLSFA